MATFWLLYLLAGAGAGQTAWGGPAIVRFQSEAECQAALSAMRDRKYFYHAECVRVPVPALPKEEQ